MLSRDGPNSGQQLCVGLELGNAIHSGLPPHSSKDDLKQNSECKIKVYTPFTFTSDLIILDEPSTVETNFISFCLSVKPRWGILGLVPGEANHQAIEKNEKL